MHWTNVLPVFYIVFFSIIRVTPHKTKNDYPYQVIYNHTDNNLKDNLRACSRKVLEEDCVNKHKKKEKGNKI